MTNRIFVSLKFYRTNLIHMIGAILLFFGFLAGSTQVNAQTFMNFTGPGVLQSGTALQQGAVYRYANVLPGIDGVVTLAQFVGTVTTITNLDDNTANAPRFQPVITCAGTAAANANTTCYIRFNFAFVQTGTSTPANVYGLAVSAQDIDGNGVANGVREFVEIAGATSVTTAATTTLITAPPLAGGTRFIQQASTDVQNGIGTGNQYEVYGRFNTAPITGFSILGGNTIGTAGCLETAAECRRQNSYTFLPLDSNVPSITVRKITTAGTGTFTFTGNNGWVTQPVTTTAAGVATSSQSEALLAAGVATTISESAPLGYSLQSITCTGLGTGTATPTILGTAGGSVLLSAAATSLGNDIVCTFTNRPTTAALSIAKTNGSNTLTVGQTTTYTITVANTAGDNAAGAIVQDPITPGLSCTSISCAGAACPAPASVTISALQSSGIVLGSFPAGSNALFTVTCDVTAI